MEKINPLENLSKLNTQERTSNIYHLESGVDVEVSCKVFESKEGKSEEAVILMAGLQMDPQDEIMKNLAESYQQSSKKDTYVINSELKKTQDKNINLESTLFNEEAVAISKFIKDKKLKKIIIAGYSIGGTKGIDLAYLLQKNNDIIVEGLILLSAPGLYEQEEDTLKSKLIKDSIFTPKQVIERRGQYPDAFKRGVQGAHSLAKILIKDSFGNKGKQKIKREFSEMEHYNPRVEELEIPIIIIQGSDDQVVEANKIVPLNIEPSNRERYLKDNLFKKSPYVKMVTADKLGKHGLPLFRAESVAESSIGLLQRFNRKADSEINSNG